MDQEKLVKKGRIAELRQELLKLQALVDQEIPALKALLIPSYEAWEYDDSAVEVRALNVVKYIRRAKEIKTKLKEIEENG